MDFTKDQNPTALYEVGIKAGENLPQYVKEASLLQEEDVVNLADAAFADSVNRLHPIHTKSATYMSAVYMVGNGMDNTPAFNAVKRAAEFYGITEDIEKAISYLKEENVKSAHTDLTSEKYALTFQIDEDDTWKAYPLNNEVEVTKAATEIVRDWVDGHIPTDWLFHASRNVVKQAHELNIHRNDIPEKVWSLGEERMVDFDNAEYEARYRKNSDEYMQSVKKAADGVISVDEAIDQWMTLDAVNNVNHKNVTSPHEAFYSGERVAAVEKMATQNVFIHDVLVPVKEVIKLNANKGALIKMAFRKDVADNIISMLDVLENGTEKAAATVSASVAKLGESQRKELLNLLLQTA